VKDKLSRGFVLPIPINKVNELPSTEVCPIHMVIQNTIDEKGQINMKYCPCHNLSYSAKHLTNLSINERYLEEEMHTIQYAFALWQILHFTTALWILHPSTLILFQKFDTDGAFKRLLFNISSAFKTIFTFGNLAFVFLRSIFGGKSSCVNFSLITEPIADVMHEAMNTNRL